MSVPQSFGGKIDYSMFVSPPFFELILGSVWERKTVCYPQMMEQTSIILPQNALLLKKLEGLYLS